MMAISFSLKRLLFERDMLYMQIETKKPSVKFFGRKFSIIHFTDVDLKYSEEETTFHFQAPLLLQHN